MAVSEALLDRILQRGQDHFVEAVRAGASAYTVADRLGMDRDLLDEWLQRDEGFRERLDRARADAIRDAMRRANRGEAMRSDD